MNYITIYKSSLSDGIDWRVVLFVSGCNHQCPGCHNPQSWDAHYGKPFTDTTKYELFQMVDNDIIDGITISGGDPLFPANIEEITKFCKEFKEKFPKKSIWLYTGYVYEEVKTLEVMQYIDILVDGPFIQAKKDNTLPFRGSTNQNIINPKTGKILNVYNKKPEL